MKTSHTTEAVHRYLVDLRDSGVTNMWGAASYLEDAFDMTRQEAKDALVEWIKSFEEKKKP